MKHQKGHPTLRSDLNGEQRRKLREFEALLRAYAQTLGLVSPRDMNRLWERHIMDSLRVLNCLLPTDRKIADVGSGAGLPGVPVAIARPESRVSLIEPKRRRAAFLELAIERLGLDNASLTIATSDQVRAGADVVMVRALAGADSVWRLASPLLNDHGRVLYFAGRNWREGSDQGVSNGLSVGGAMVETCVAPELDWEGPIVMMKLAGPSAEDGG